MSGELVSFLAAHLKRAQELFATEVQAVNDRAPAFMAAHASPRSDAFIDSVLVALGDDNILPMLTLFDLVTKNQGLPARLDGALTHVAGLRRAINTLADQERLPDAERVEVARITGEALDTIGRQLSLRVAANLAEQVASGAAPGRAPSLSITMHELRRPLTILSSYGQLLAAGVLGPLPDSAQVAIEGISASTEMMVRMVNALAEVSRLEDPDDHLVLEDMDIDDLVSGSIEQIGMEAQLREIRLRRVVPDNVQLRCDRRRMTLALTNLVSNAVKHGPNGSEVVIATRAGNGQVHFVVTDQGPGFPPEDGGHLFEKYFRSAAERQRKVPGSGLGLFIVKTIAERHQGTVSARSAGGGVGAEFELVIPVRQEDQSARIG